MGQAFAGVCSKHSNEARLTPYAFAINAWDNGIYNKPARVEAAFCSKLCMFMCMFNTIAESAAKRTLGNVNAVVCMSHGDQGAHSISLAWPACCTPQAQDWHLLAWSIHSYLVATGMTP